jgi:hypothetical protein
MQYSTNSDAAIIGEIRSACTPAGRYRRAALIAKDKSYTLANFAIEREKQLLEIKRLEASANEIQAIRLESKQIEAQQLRLNAKLVELHLKNSEHLVEDAMREYNTAIAEMKKICNEAGIDFEALSVDELQALMADEYSDRQVRYQLAGLYSAQSGIPIDRVEMLLETPPEDLMKLLSRMMPMVDQNPLFLLKGGQNAVS